MMLKMDSLLHTVTNILTLFQRDRSSVKQFEMVESIMIYKILNGYWKDRILAETSPILHQTLNTS